MKIALFDYGAGNLHSLGKALEVGGASVTVTSHWKEALALDALVLPGVGAFGAAVKSLGPERARVRDALEGGLPCLGICLGMQLFFHRSHEGEGDGIGFVSGIVRRLRTDIVPQMGWNDITIIPTGAYRDVGAPGRAHDASPDGDLPSSHQGLVSPDPDQPSSHPGLVPRDPDQPSSHPGLVPPDPLFDGLGELVAYYANSYVCQTNEPGTVIATTTYQGDRFPAAVHKVNTWGVQFHPEKSSGPGLRLISNFLKEAESCRS
jgi:imidazoleglycerol phosphate synthase glutamine amidotransferase subunit HisH